MRTLVVGSSGLLGSSLVAKLNSFGHELILPSSSGKGDLKCDFSRLEEVEKIINAEKPAMIINLAALTNVDQCENDPDIAYLLNSKIPLNISKTIKHLDEEIRFIHISTDHVYQSVGFSSEDDVSPVNIYGYSKLLGEAYAGNSLVLRTNFVGKSNCKDRIGFIDWIFNSLSKGKNIPLFYDSEFTPLSISQLCDAIAYCIHNHSNGIYNLGSVGSMSKYDFGLEFAKKAGLDFDLIERKSIDQIKLNARRPKSMSMNSDKFIRDFNYKLPTIDQVLSEVVKGYENESK